MQVTSPQSLSKEQRNLSFFYNSAEKSASQGSEDELLESHLTNSSQESIPSTDDNLKFTKKNAKPTTTTNRTGTRVKLKRTLEMNIQELDCSQSPRMQNQVIQEFIDQKIEYPVV